MTPKLPDCNEDVRSGHDKSLPDWTWQLEAGDMEYPHAEAIGDYWGWLLCWSAYEAIENQNNIRHERELSVPVMYELVATAKVKSYRRFYDYQKSHTLDHNARVWNTTMRRLGYDIDREACLKDV